MALVEQILVTIYIYIFPLLKIATLSLIHRPSDMLLPAVMRRKPTASKTWTVDTYLGWLGWYSTPKKNAWIRRLPYRSSSCIIRYHLWLLPADSLRKEQRLIAAASMVAVVDIFGSIWSSPFSTSRRFFLVLPEKKQFGLFGLPKPASFEHSPTWDLWNLISDK